MISPYDDTIQSRISYVFAPLRKEAIINPTSQTLLTEMNGHKFWKLTSESGYTCPGTAVTRASQEPVFKKYCCFKNEYLAENYQLQAHKSEQSLGDFSRKFRIAEARDDVINVISTGHFNFKEFDQSSSMVYSDGKHIINDDNFDYDKSRIMDIVEVSNVEEIAKGEFENYAYTGSDRKFSFWTASADGFYSVGARVTTSFEKSRFLKNAPFDFLKNLGTYSVFNALSDEHIEKCST